MQFQYLVRRLLQTILVVVLVSILTFFLLSVLPGDAIVIAITGDASLTQEQIQQTRHNLGLDRPAVVQYLDWAGGLLRGDWGTSIRTRQHVLEALQARAPITLLLSSSALVIALIIAIPVGVVAALNRNTWIDRASTTISLMGIAMPSLWLGLLLILLFSITLKWLPASGFVAPWDDPVAGIKRLILPALTLGVAESATIMRQTRSSMLEVLGQDYVRTAYAKGLPRRTVIAHHALRNALTPILTVVGIRLGNILGGSVIVETIFAMPGMGRLAVQAIFAHDLPVVMGFVMIVATMVAIGNLLTDIAYGFADPRVQVGRRGGEA